MKSFPDIFSENPPVIHQRHHSTIFRNRQNNIVFIGIYTALSVYFASVMIRLLLVFAPAACVSAAIGISWLFELCTDSIKEAWASLKKNNKEKPNKKEKSSGSIPV